MWSNTHKGKKGNMKFMGKSYEELSKLKAEDYLNPNNFKTEFDRINPRRSQEQYETGLRWSNSAEEIHLNFQGIWSAKMKDGSFITSYEGIGYHGNTAELLKGFLEGIAPLIVHRQTENGTIEAIKIKEKKCKD